MNDSLKIAKSCRHYAMCKIDFLGTALKFNALYVPVRSAQVIRDMYLEDIRKNYGKKASECRVHLDERGNLHLPMKIYIPEKGKINLIPVDCYPGRLGEKTIMQSYRNQIPRCARVVIPKRSEGSYKSCTQSK